WPRGPEAEPDLILAAHLELAGLRVGEREPAVVGRRDEVRVQVRGPVPEVHAPWRPHVEADLERPYALLLASVPYPVAGEKESVAEAYGKLIPGEAVQALHASRVHVRDQLGVGVLRAHAGLGEGLEPPALGHRDLHLGTRQEAGRGDILLQVELVQ